MKTKVIYSKKGRKDLLKLEPKTAQRIALKVQFYSEQSDPLKHASNLNPPFDDLYKYRVGDYRVIFEADSKGSIFILTILKVGHRKDVYR